MFSGARPRVTLRSKENNTHCSFKHATNDHGLVTSVKMNNLLRLFYETHRSFGRPGCHFSDVYDKVFFQSVIRKFKTHLCILHRDSLTVSLNCIL